MIKIITHDDKEILVDSIPKDKQLELVKIFNLLSFKEKQLLDQHEELTPIFKIKFSEIKSLEYVEDLKENLMGLYDCLPYCSEEFVAELYKKGKII